MAAREAVATDTLGPLKEQGRSSPFWNRDRTMGNQSILYFVLRTEMLQRSYST
jgi:hypothetical protein